MAQLARSPCLSPYPWSMMVYARWQLYFIGHVRFTPGHNVEVCTSHSHGPQPRKPNKAHCESEIERERGGGTFSLLSRWPLNDLTPPLDVHTYMSTLNQKPSKRALKALTRTGMCTLGSHHARLYTLSLGQVPPVPQLIRKNAELVEGRAPTSPFSWSVLWGFL